MLLRAIYGGLADNRAALAQATGLAKPTVSNLIAELLAEGLLIESGRGPSTESGGKRPRLLEFSPGAREVIGLSVDALRVVGVLSDLSGRITARHSLELSGREPLAQMRAVVAGLVAQCDAPLLCIGVGVPGAVDARSGVVRQSAALGWQSFPLAERLQESSEVPVFVGNSAELCALGQFAFASDGAGPGRLVTVLIDGGVEIGVTLEDGAYHYGGDIGRLGALGPAACPLSDFLGWKAVQARVEALRARHPGTCLPASSELSYMHLRYSAAAGDVAALALLDELAAALASVLSWVVGLLQPDEVSLAGPVVDLGEGFMDEAGRLALASLGGVAPPTAFSLAYSDNLGAIGAVALALQKELAIL